MTRPHRITDDDLDRIRLEVATRETVIAAAITADQTQHKRLMQVGSAYEVRRAYVGTSEWEPICCTPSLSEAARSYNRLS